jgi:hypothetical protein
MFSKYRSGLDFGSGPDPERTRFGADQKKEYFREKIESKYKLKNIRFL